MPFASIAASAIKKYWLQDHDSDIIQEAPPTVNVWYTLFDDEDVRLLEMFVQQINEEEENKTLQVRWTIDGNVYFVEIDAANTTEYYVFRNLIPSLGGTLGLSSSSNQNRAFIDDFKCGLSFKVEVRIITAVGTNQALNSLAVHETLEVT